MIHLPLKPLSTNALYNGQRTKSKLHAKYKRDLAMLLPSSTEIPNNCELLAVYEFGVSNRNTDVDNLIKGLQDALQEKYGFNDNRITQIIATKTIVEKGSEFIRFDISENE